MEYFKPAVQLGLTATQEQKIMQTLINILKTCISIFIERRNPRWFLNTV